MTANQQSVTKIHFTIDKDKVDVFNRSKSKIEEIFDVDVYFDNADGSWNEQSQCQWITVQGKSCDCQDAKEYVINLCNPEESVQVKCQCDDVGLRHEIFRGVEKNTRAVIHQIENDTVGISGSLLSVTLAVSSLEEFLDAKFDRSTGSDSGDQRLNHVLRQTLSHIDNVEVDLDDYESVPSNVKRAMIDTINLDMTMENIHDEDLFEDGGGAKTPVNMKTSFTKGMQPMTSSTYKREQNKPLILQNNRVQELKDDKFIDLRKFASTVGYSQDEIEEGLLYVKDSTKPTEFLPMLSKIRERKRELGLLPIKERKIARKENIGQDVIECMDSSFEDDVIIVEVTPPGVGTRSKTKVDNSKLQQEDLDDSCIEVLDEQQALKELYAKQEKKSATNPKSSANNNDKDQTEVMSIWDGSRSKTDNSATSNKSETKQIQALQPRASNVNETEHSKPSRFTDIVEKPSLDKQPSHPPVGSADVSDSVLKKDETKAVNDKGELRYVVVDGSNVARGHGNGAVFSCLGIKLCVDYFLKRGHKRITVFVPGWRQKRGTATHPIKNQEILEELKQAGYLAFTPHKQLPSGQRVASYDDRFILDLADKEDGVIVSNDQYRDFFSDKASYRIILEERVIPFVFVVDNFMLPEDPYGQKGPMLDEILVKPFNHRSAGRQTYQQSHHPYQQHQQHQQKQQYYQQQQQQHYRLQQQQHYNNTYYQQMHT